MSPYIESVIVIGSIYIGSLFAPKEKRPTILTYIICFIVMLGISFLTRVQASEHSIVSKLFSKKLQFEREFSREITILRSHYAALDPVMREHYEKMAKRAKKLGQEALDEAKEICWYLPNYNDRENARYCFATALALIAPNTPMSKLIAVIVGTLGNYGLDCLDEWERIDYLLYLSQYHFEMAEFYEDVLRKE